MSSQQPQQYKGYQLGSNIESTIYSNDYNIPKASYKQNNNGIDYIINTNNNIQNDYGNLALQPNSGTNNTLDEYIKRSTISSNNINPNGLKELFSIDENGNIKKSSDITNNRSQSVINIRNPIYTDMIMSNNDKKNNQGLLFDIDNNNDNKRGFMTSSNYVYLNTDPSKLTNINDNKYNFENNYQKTLKLRDSTYGDDTNNQILSFGESYINPKDSVGSDNLVWNSYKREPNQNPEKNVKPRESIKKAGVAQRSTEVVKPTQTLVITNTQTPTLATIYQMSELEKKQAEEISTLRDQISYLKNNEEIISKLRDENNSLATKLNAKFAEINYLNDNPQVQVIEKIIEKPIYIEKIIEKVVQTPIEKPIYLEKIIEKPIEKIIEKPIEKITYVVDDKVKIELNELRESIQRYKIMERDFKLLQEKLDKLNMLNINLQKDNQVLLDKCKTLQVDQDRYINLERELGILSEKYKQCQLEKDKYMGMYTDLKNINLDLKQSQNDKEKYEQNLKQISYEKEKLERQLNQILYEKEKLEKEMKNIQYDKEKLEKEIMNIKIEKDRLSGIENQYLILNEKLKQAQLERDEALSKTLQKDKEMQIYINKVKDIESESQKHKVEKEILKSSAQHNQHKDNLINDLMNKLQNMDKIISNMEIKLNQKEEIINDKDNQINQLRQQIKNTENNLDLEDQLKKMKQERNSLLSQLQGLQSNKTSIEDELNQKNKILIENNGLIKDLYKKLRDYEQQINLYDKQQVENLMIENQKLNIELANIKAYLKNKGINDIRELDSYFSGSKIYIQQQPESNYKNSGNRDRESPLKASYNNIMNNSPKKSQDSQQSQRFGNRNKDNNQSSLQQDNDNYSPSNPMKDNNNNEIKVLSESIYYDQGYPYSKQSMLKNNRQRDEGLKSAGVGRQETDNTSNANQNNKLVIDNAKLKEENDRMIEIIRKLEGEVDRLKKLLEKEMNANSVKDNQIRDNEIKIMQLQKSNEDLKIVLDQKDKKYKEEIEKLKVDSEKKHVDKADEIIMIERQKYEDIIRELKKGFNEMEKKVESAYNENKRLNEIAHQRTQEIEGMKHKYINLSRRDSDRKLDVDLIKRVQTENEELKLQHEREINGYRIKIQQLVQLVDSKEEELKSLYDMNKRKKDENETLQEKLDKLHNAEIDLQLMTEKYEQIHKEYIAIEQGRDYYASEFGKLMKTYNDLMGRVGSKAELEASILESKDKSRELRKK